MIHRPVVVAAFLAAASLALSGCGGMTRTVGVFPDTMDDLGAKSAAIRGEESPELEPTR